MAMSLSLADFKMISAVCELRYESAYLIYDRTGLICHETRSIYPDCNVSSAAPNQTYLQFSEGSFALELTQCRFSTTKPDSSLEKFAGHCKSFFNSVVYNLDVKVFTRVGLRVLLRKEFRDLTEAKAALTSLRLVTLQPVERFGAASEPQEVYFRWQGPQLGAMVHFRAESGKIDVILPPELEAEKSEIHKSFNGLVLDVDYYTVAPVERSQWDAPTWIPRSIRTVKKEIGNIIGS